MDFGGVFGLFVVFDGDGIPGIGFDLGVGGGVFGEEGLESFVHKLQILNKIICIKNGKMERYYKFCVDLFLFIS